MRLDGHLVHACARRAAVAEQVEALGVADDPLADGVEGRGDGGGVGDEHVAAVPDVVEDALVDLVAHADGEDVVAGLGDPPIHVAEGDARSAVGSVGEDHDGPEAERDGRALDGGVEHVGGFDDRAIEVGRGVAGAEARQAGYACAALAEGLDGVDLGAAVEGVHGDLLMAGQGLGEASRSVDDQRHLVGLGDTPAHVHQEQRVVLGGHLRVHDGLLALVDRDELAVLVDGEIARLEPWDRLAAAGVDGEEDADVARSAVGRVHELEVQAGAAEHERNQQE